LIVEESDTVPADVLAAFAAAPTFRLAPKKINDRKISDREIAGNAFRCECIHFTSDLV
jgi:hypothetical protein